MRYKIETKDDKEALFITNLSNIRSCLFNILHNLGKEFDQMEEQGVLDADNAKQKLAEYTEKIQHLYE